MSDLESIAHMMLKNMNMYYKIKLERGLKWIS